MKQPARRRPRHRPLETCGGVILATARVVYTRSKTLNLKNPALSLALKLFQAVIYLASMTSLFHRHFLAILSVADDHILAVQDTIETYFPSSTFFFLKISDLLILAESLPEKLDGFLEKLPSSINRVTWFEFALMHAIYWLDLVANVLDRWRDKNRGTNEKEIVVDRSFSRSGSVTQQVEEEDEKMNLENDGKKVSYKEALQRGSSGEDGGGSNRGDPIFEQFENDWIQNPIKRSSRSADSLTFSRSESLSN